MLTVFLVNHESWCARLSGYDGVLAQVRVVLVCACVYLFVFTCRSSIGHVSATYAHAHSDFGF